MARQATESSGLPAKVQPLAAATAPVPIRGRAHAAPGTEGVADETILQSLIDLAADIYWEQDAGHRFTVVRARDETIPASALAGPGKRCWDIDYRNMTPAAWNAHRADLRARRGFHDRRRRAARLAQSQRRADIRRSR